MNVSASHMSREDLERYAQEAIERLELYKQQHVRPKICNFAGGNDLSSLTNDRIAEFIKAKLPKYESIEVSEVDYEFENNAVPLKSRVIVITRLEINSLTDSLAAFFSSLFIMDSMYTRSIDKDGVKNYLLDSKKLTDKEYRQSIEKDLEAAYCQALQIRLVVPNNLEEDARIFLKSKSKVIYRAIRSAEIIKNLLR